MKTYTCNSCNIIGTSICTSIGITPPHACPYSLGDFEWNTISKQEEYNTFEFCKDIECSSYDKILKACDWNFCDKTAKEVQEWLKSNNC